MVAIGFPATALLMVPRVARVAPRAPLARMLSNHPEEPQSVAQSLAAARAQLADVSAACGRAAPPRLVAVSKTKPLELLREAYDAGQRDFGENYVHELVDKAPHLPEDISWRFIGKLQSNKVKTLLRGVPTLSAFETLDSAKLASKLHAALTAPEQPPRQSPLDVFIQVNTSPWEGTKGGVLAEDAPELASHVSERCGSLRLAGLMTIGAAGDSRCFDALVACRAKVAAELNVSEDALELSMGMSGDYEEATRAGSSSVRVGSAIFGAREYPAKAAA